MHMPVSFLQAPRPWHGVPSPPEPHLWYSQALPKLRLSSHLHWPTSSPSISWVMHSPRLLHAEADHPANLDRLQRHPQM